MCAAADQRTCRRIEYRLIDLTVEEGLARFGPGEVDGAVCNRALMDIARITPLLRALRRTLKAGARFVAELRSWWSAMGDGTMTFSVRVRHYRNMTPSEGDFRL